MTSQTIDVPTTKQHNEVVSTVIQFACCRTVDVSYALPAGARCIDDVTVTTVSTIRKSRKSWFDDDARSARHVEFDYGCVGRTWMG
jgi:hypothetical protein